MRATLLAVGVTLAALAAAKDQKCRCLPSDPCWPSKDVWSAFEKKLSNPLIPLRPIADPCYRASSDFSPSICSSVQANFNSPTFRANQPEAAQFTTWEQIITNTTTQECLPDNVNGTGTCFQGRVPFAAVNVSTIQDIQETLRFSSAHNLHLVVKNTGHEAIGRSFGIGSLALWTHHLKDMNFTDSFIPTNSPAGANGTTAVTIGAGVQWAELYDAADANGKVVVGGIGAGGSVGAGGGWVQGAGHSILSPFFGLGVDNAMEFSVVLPNASHVIANAHVNPDIFWALRGGGGPSFGVVTSLTYRTHESLPVTAAFFTATMNSNESRLALMQEWVESHANISDAGWGGFVPYDNTSLFLTLMAQGNPPTNPQANATLQAFFDKAATMPGVNVSLALSKPYTGFTQWYNDNFINSSNGIGFNYTIGDFSGVTAAVASRLIPRETFTNNASALAQAMAQIPTARGFLVGGGVVSQVDPDAAALSPAWRSMLMDLTIALNWDEHATAEEIQAVREGVTGWADLLRDITPTGGSYLNEADILEVNWQQAYWGDHYPRLQAIKRALDPDELLIVNKGVNSEPWDSEILCRTSS